jgi:recombination protein RecR
VYHVLGGKISPDGVGPSQLRIGTLVEKVKAGSVNEVILRWLNNGRRYH